ncbi:MAG: hypothetical protein ACT4QF_21370 [Sporichthyaceae bacterium]
METVVGFVVGFLVGSREGKEGVAKIVESWGAIRESAQVKNLIGTALGLALPVARDLTKAIRA